MRVAFGAGMTLSTDLTDISTTIVGVLKQHGITVAPEDAVAVLSVGANHVLLGAHSVTALRDGLCEIVLPGEDLDQGED